MHQTGEVCAIILAGGSGERFGRAGGKQLALASGRPVLAWTVEAFDRCSSIDSIVLVCPEGRQAEYAEAAFEGRDLSTPIVFAASGQTRQASMASGLAHAPEATSIIAVHDGARPLIAPATIEGALRLLDREEIDGVVVGNPSYDTLKLVDGTRVVDTPDRARYWQAQTPQIFRRRVLAAALEQAVAEGFVGTDDSAVVEHAGAHVVMYDAPRDNIKVTVAADIAYVEAALRCREEESS